MRSVCFTSDGFWVLSTSWDGSAGIWDLRRRRELKTLVSKYGRGNSDEPAALDTKTLSAINEGSLSTDGTRLATASWDGVVHVWEVPSGTELLRYTGHGRIVWSVAFSPDGRTIASLGADCKVRVWDSRSAHDIWSGRVNVSGVTTVQRHMLAFSQDGRLLATCDGYESHGPFGVRLWDAATGEKLMWLPNLGSQINGVTFSPDGTRVATAGEDQTVKLWDTTSGQNIFVLRGHTASVLAVAFSSDGQRLASGSVDATVRIWDAPHDSDHRVSTGDAALSVPIPSR